MAPKWVDAAFDGVGASRAGGRWNSTGVRVVYLGSSLALAALELLAHIDYERALDAYVAIPVDFDEALLLTLDEASLPAGWATSEGLADAQSVGDAWVGSRASALLAVPSRLITAERNVLLNPDHRDAAAVVSGERRPFRYDPDILKR